MSDDFIRRIRECDITHDELTQLRVAIVYGGILKKDTKMEINACLGVLRDILDEARKPKTPCEPVRREGVE